MFVTQYLARRSFRPRCHFRGSRQPWLVPALAVGVLLTACGGGGSPATDPAGSSGSGSTSSPAQAGTLSWSAAQSRWPGTAAAAALTVSRSGGSDGTVTVDWSTADGTAVAGRDYVHAGGTLRWGNKDSAPKAVVVPLGAPGTAGGHGAFKLALSAPAGGASLGPPAQAAIDLDTAWTVPASLHQFDLSHWRLDLPVDANGGTGGVGGTQYAADAILPAELSTTYVSPWFYADASHRIVFTAPANGAVTTPGRGSDHTRSELREVYAGPGATPLGDWTGQGTLAATCTVLSVADASDVAVIAQLRSDTNDFALLLYRPAKRDVALDLYASNAKGSAHHRTEVAANVNLGDAITYRLAYTGSTLTTTVDGITRTDSTAWKGVPLYFKLGAYHAAPHTGNAVSSATMVSFSAFSVAH